MTIQMLLDAMNAWNLAHMQPKGAKAYLKIVDGKGDAYFVNHNIVVDANNQPILKDGQKVFKWVIGKKMTPIVERVAPVEVIQQELPLNYKQ
jgi:hypothetical protein